MWTSAESRLQEGIFGIYGNRNQRIGNFKTYRASDLFEGQPLLERLGVFDQSKKAGIAFLVFFGRMRMMKIVIQLVVGKMFVNKMSISFQSRGMITPRMLMILSLTDMAMRGFGVIMGWKQDELKCPKTNQSKHQPIIFLAKSNH